MRPLELWGGLECTLNRVGDIFINQSSKNGHLARISDLKLFSDLGLKKIRYPCLWELVAPDHEDVKDWSWLVERLTEIQKLGMDPIAGFLHHGSGPKYTNLLDSLFPEKFASFAKAFAERFPWIEFYTPINEINTTARFSCLYGHWFPHHKNDRSYLNALISQAKATVLAMKEIRKINPLAKLLQTDDLGKTSSTPLLKYQSDFENERRWLAYDLLLGKVSQNHPLYSYFINSGINEEDLTWFIENPCPPDIIGINHYPLSNRFLDDELEHYPKCFHGGNGRHHYADVGAIDTGRADIISPEVLMMETWYRYQIPIAVTEVHIRGHREEQMRWLHYLWKNALRARDKNAKVLAVTAWSLLGTYDWHNLCTKDEMFYEPGVFDLRTADNKPKKTGLSQLAKDLAIKGCSDFPFLDDLGYWETQRRVLFAVQKGSFSSLTKNSRPVLIIGASGTLGQAFARICGSRNLNYRILKRLEVDICNKDSIKRIIEELNPWAIINAAGYVKVDQAETERELCFRENVLGPINLAETCSDKNLPFVTFSSDLVFDGEQEEGYHENHLTNPLNVYGESKAYCEKKVLAICPHALIIRTSSFFSPWDNYNFLTCSLRDLEKKSPLRVISDIKISPTYVPDLVNATLDLLVDGEKGIIHLTNKGSLSWAEFLRRAVLISKDKTFDQALINDCSLIELNLTAKRPRNSTLLSRRWSILPDLDDAIARYFSQT